MLRHRHSIIWQILVPLVAVSTGVVAIASWFDFQALTQANRTAALRELSLEAQRRAEVDGRVFTQAERNLRQCREVFRRRLTDPSPSRALPRSADGARRLAPVAGAPPLAAFLARSVANADQEQHSLAVAVGILDELGPSWCDQFPAIAIGEPSRWLATWGAPFADLSTTMLPDDPVLLTSEVALLNQPGLDVRWSGAYFEPGTSTWCVTALIPIVLPNGRRAAVYHPVPIRELLVRVGEGLPAGTVTAVLDRNGQAITCTASPLPPEAPGEVHVTLPERFLHAISGATEVDTGVHQTDNGDGWFAVSRLSGPDWAVVTHLPPELVIGPARRAAEHSMFVGGVAILILSIAIALILRWRVALPLRTLQTEVARLAHGGTPPSLRRIRHDEIGNLNIAFVEMAGEVSSSQANLRLAINALTQRERLYRTLFAAAADAVLVLRDGCVVDANERACQLFNTESTLLLGANPSQLAPELQADGMNSLTRLRGLLAQPPHHPAPWRARRHDGVEIDTEISVGRVPQPEGDLIVVALRDVTERNQLDQQLRQVQKMETVGQLAGGIAHDFNNVLTGIVGSAELLSRRVAADERSTTMVTRILQASERATAMIQKLMTFTRKGRQISSPIDVHVVVHDTCALLERSVEARIAIVQKLDAANSVIIGDATPLQTSLLNLGVNARDALPHGGSITFSTIVTGLTAAEGQIFAPPLPAGSYLELCVSDTGTGMSADTLKHLFEPFFTTKAIGKGTGLGLPAVLRTVHDHHGAIDVRSELGRGTTFRILLPLSSEALSDEPAESLPIRGRGRILVIDDDDLVRGTAVEMLRSLGYDTVEANNGRTGVAAYVQETFDVVLIDMEMPVLRGTDCLREIRASDPAVRAILCSGFNRESGSTDIRGEGFRGFLQKPYRLFDLSSVVADVAAGKAHL